MLRMQQPGGGLPEPLGHATVEAPHHRHRPVARVDREYDHRHHHRARLPAGADERQRRERHHRGVSSASSTQVAADFAVAADTTGGNRGVTVTARGRTSNAVSFFVQIPTRLIPTHHPNAPGGVGPLQKPVNGDVRDLRGTLIAVNQCGVYRNYAYALLDQEGQRIFQAFKIEEEFDCDECPFGEPTAEPGSIPANEVIADIQNLTRTFPQCILTGERERFLIGFNVLVGPKKYQLSTVVFVERGSINGELQVNASIIIP